MPNSRATLQNSKPTSISPTLTVSPPPLPPFAKPPSPPATRILHASKKSSTSSGPPNPAPVFLWSGEFISPDFSSVEELLSRRNRHRIHLPVALRQPVILPAGLFGQQPPQRIDPQRRP